MVKPSSTKQTIDDHLIEIINTISYYHDRSGITYADIVDKHQQQRFVEIQSEEFEGFIRNEFVKKSKTLPGAQKLSAAVAHAKYIASNSDNIIDVGFRFHCDDHDIIIDLSNSDNEAVVLNSKGWRVMETDTKFRRTNTMMSLPDPARNGDPNLIFDYVNLSNEEDRLLFLSWLCLLPMMNIVRPMIAFTGEAGSAKTSSARFTRMVFDPASPLESTSKMTQDDLSVAFYHNPIVFFDNMGKIPKFISDIFCQAITGGGYSKRAQYTNYSQVSIAFKRPIIISALGLPSMENDFLDRLIQFEMTKPGNNLKSEIELNRNFERDHAKILGGCLNTLTSALNKINNVTLSDKIRLVDFINYGEAVSLALDYGPNAFSESLSNRIRNVKCNAVTEEEPIIEMIVAFMNTRENHEYDGMVSELFKNIIAGMNNKYYNKRVPTNANTFGKLLSKNTILDALHHHGLAVSKYQTRDGKKIHIKRVTIDENKDILKSDHECETQDEFTSYYNTDQYIESLFNET
jgi:hypothetical protein